MDYEKKYNEALARAKEIHHNEAEKRKDMEFIFHELKEPENELTWLTNYISSEAYNLSMDIRDYEDSIKLKNLRKALTWLEKQTREKSIEKK